MSGNRIGTLPVLRFERTMKVQGNRIRAVRSLWMTEVACRVYLSFENVFLACKASCHISRALVLQPCSKQDSKLCQGHDSCLWGHSFLLDDLNRVDCVCPVFSLFTLTRMHTAARAVPWSADDGRGVSTDLFTIRSYDYGGAASSCTVTLLLLGFFLGFSWRMNCSHPKFHLTGKHRSHPADVRSPQLAQKTVRD